MTKLENRTGIKSATKLVLVVAVAFVAVLAAAFFAAPVRSAPTPSGLTVASGGSEQWAFGGSLGASYSCANAACFGGNASGINGTISLSYRFYVEWVVIYTQTNVSATQTMVEGQVAINASASVSLDECQNVSMGVPCTAYDISANLAGSESAVGFTNITTGTVNVTANPSGPLGSTPALAISNASSNEAFNFSGSLSETIPTGLSGTQTVGGSFDIGAHEQTAVTFSSPLGIVPVNPVPNEMWNSSAPYTATGAYTTGYTVSGTGPNGTTESERNWTQYPVSHSGTLWVEGSDLGTATLWDNYTSPPSSTTAQEILVEFGTGAFVGTDGWLLIPSGLYGGIGGLLGGGLASTQGPSGPVTAAAPASSISVGPSSESAYYEKGTGFIGASETGNLSALSSVTGGASTPGSLSLNAGPEPVSVAQQQYGAITSGSGSSSSGFPTTWLIVGVVVVLVVIVGIVLMMRRGRTPPTAAPGTMPGATVPPTTTSGGNGPGAPPS